MTYLQVCEAAANGSPDKVSDQVSDAILDAYLAADPYVRAAIDACVAGNTLVIGGTVATTATNRVDHAAVARDCLRTLSGKVAEPTVAELTVEVLDRVFVDRRGSTRGAGFLGHDGGTAVGYACAETSVHLPVPVVLANTLVRGLASLRRQGTFPWLRADGDASAAVEYEGEGRPRRIHSIAVRVQHDASISLEDLRRALEDPVRSLVLSCVPASLVDAHTRVSINPAGPFLARPVGTEAGATGRRLASDTYGGRASDGGWALSGRDPLRPARAGAYMARYVAKTIVLAEMADACEVALAWQPGHAEPVSLRIRTSARNHPTVADEVIERAVRAVMPLSPEGIARKLDLLQPIFEETSFGGHFGRDEPAFSWERTDQVESLWDAVGSCRRTSVPAPIPAG